MVASWKGHPALVEILIKAGADLNAKAEVIIITVITITIPLSTPISIIIILLLSALLALFVLNSCTH